MNVNDVEVFSEEVSCKLTDIFERQMKLVEKYHPIEKSNGLLLAEDIPLNVHDRMAQYRIKDMAWRVTEELSEAYEAYCIHPDNLTHFQEELSDAFHFFIELLISVGIGPNNFPANRCRLENIYLRVTASETETFSPMTSISTASSMFSVIHGLGLAMNCLKNKPWKQTHMLTDENKFKGYLKGTMDVFILMFHDFNMDSQQIYDMYLRKNAVNTFRQVSKY